MSPSVGDAKILSWKLAEVAQLVEHHLAKVRVAGSNPVFRSSAKGRRDNAYLFADSISTGECGGVAKW